MTKVNLTIGMPGHHMESAQHAARTNYSLTDRFSRTISYLRLSITDRCNLRCLYCMPCERDGQRDSSIPVIENISATELLSYEELVRIVRIAVKLGMLKIRLTGGEPLVRRNVLGFIKQLTELEGLEQIRLTTNGVLLKENARRLYALGVRHLNISLDSLNRAKFRQITGKDLLDQVLAGIEEAVATGFTIKLNVVAMRGQNDDEFVHFAQFGLERDIQVRFIEFMPIGKDSSWAKDQYIEANEIQQRIAARYSLRSLQNSRGDGPARVYKIDGGDGSTGKIGFISPISHHFCGNCNRLRLTSDGRLRACLLHDGDTDLKSLLRGGCDDADIERAIRNTIQMKPEGHQLKGEALGNETCRVNMSRIGG